MRSGIAASSAPPDRVRERVGVGAGPGERDPVFGRVGNEFIRHAPDRGLPVARRGDVSPVAEIRKGRGCPLAAGREAGNGSRERALDSVQALKHRRFGPVRDRAKDGPSQLRPSRRVEDRDDARPDRLRPGKRGVGLERAECLRVVDHDDVGGIGPVPPDRGIVKPLLQREGVHAPPFQLPPSRFRRGDDGDHVPGRLVGPRGFRRKPRLSGPRTAGDDRQAAAFGACPHRLAKGRLLRGRECFRRFLRRQDARLLRTG